jgi:type I restriction enzyme S subunit
MTVNVHDVRYLPLKPDWESYLLEAGDLLFTRYNGNPDLVGACGVVPDAGRGVAFPDKLIRARFDQEQLLPRYAQVMMNSGPSRDFIRARVRTTAGQAGISGSDLKQCPIAIPPIGLQALIADEVDRHLSLIKAADTAVVSALARAAALRQSILARAFRGELVAQDPSDEPAEALLERIRAERAGVVPVKRAVRKKRVAGKK